LHDGFSYCFCLLTESYSIKNQSINQFRQLKQQPDSKVITSVEVIKLVVNNFTAKLPANKSKAVMRFQYKDCLVSAQGELWTKRFIRQ